MMIRVNFVTKEYRAKLATQKYVSIAILILIVVAGVEYAGFMFFNQIIKNVQKQKEEKITQTNEVQNAINILLEEEKGIKDLSGEIKIIEDLFKQKNLRFSEILSAIKDSSQDKMWFTDFEYKDGKVKITGVAYDINQTTTAEINVFNFERSLKDSKKFADVKAMYMKDGEELGNRIKTFQYELVLKSEDMAEAGGTN